MSNLKRNNGLPDGINPAKRRKTITDSEENITETGFETPIILKDDTLVSGDNEDDDDDEDEDDEDEDEDDEDDEDDHYEGL